MKLLSRDLFSFPLSPMCHLKAGEDRSIQVKTTEVHSQKYTGMYIFIQCVCLCAFHQSLAACFVDEVIITHFLQQSLIQKCVLNCLSYLTVTFIEMNTDTSYLEICFLLAMISSKKTEALLQLALA